jgi:hypothetical protein
VFPLHHYFEFSGVFVPNRQPERAIRLEHSTDFANPTGTPLQVLIGLHVVFVNVVVVTDVEGRIGECQIDAALFEVTHPLNAVFIQDLIKFKRQFNVSAAKTRSDLIVPRWYALTSKPLFKNRVALKV